MQTLTKVTPNAIDYVKCGEILKSQKDFLDPYILRCIKCEEIHLLLESFISHFDDTCKTSTEAKKDSREQKKSSINEAKVVNEPLECEEEPPVEDTNVQMEDPPTDVENEADVEQSIIKIEPTKLEEPKNFEFESSTYCDNSKNIIQDEDEVVDEDDTSLNTQDGCESQETEPEEFEVTQTPYNNGGAISSFVKNFMRSEKNVTPLIAAFKDQPQLWDKTLPDYGNKLKRREYMDKIAKDLNANHKIDINGSKVSAVILHLYRKYQDDLFIVQEKDESKIQMYVKPWYLTQLDFIKPYLENFSLELLGPTRLLSDQIVQIFEIYKNFPHLWNTSLIENHCKNKRHESVLEMLKQLETNMNLKISENILEQYLRTINYNFSKQKRLTLNKVDQTNSDYYEQLTFLYDHVAPFRCSVCGIESVSPLHFKMHTSTHDGTTPFTCSQCNKTFKQTYLYTIHAKRHFEDLNFICKECDKKFVSRANLKVHMRIHTGDKPYCCEICGDSFTFMQTLSNHRRRHEKRYMLKCKICSLGFYSKMRHDDHMNSHLNIRSHICDVCNKAFVTKRALKLHKAVHDDIRNFACKLCGKTFKHKSGVRQHMKTHDVALGYLK